MIHDKDKLVEQLAHDLSMGFEIMNEETRCRLLKDLLVRLDEEFISGIVCGLYEERENWHKVVMFVKRKRMNDYVKHEKSTD